MEKRKREQEEMGDAMKSLENRTMDSKREMDILAALDEMKSMKVMCISFDIHVQHIVIRIEEPEKHFPVLDLFGTKR